MCWLFQIFVLVPHNCTTRAFLFFGLRCIQMPSWRQHESCYGYVVLTSWRNWYFHCSSNFSYTSISKFPVCWRLLLSFRFYDFCYSFEFLHYTDHFWLFHLPGCFHYVLLFIHSILFKLFDCRDMQMKKDHLLLWAEVSKEFSKVIY